MPTGNFVQSRVVYKSPDRPAFVNVLWWNVSGPVGDPAAFLADFNLALDGDIGSALKACLTAGCNYVGISTTLNLSGVVYTDLNTDNAGPGTVLEDELPSYCAVVIQKRTGYPGRSGRGRWYVGGVPETFANESVLTAGAETAYEALALNYRANRIGAGVECQAAHYSAKDDLLIPILGTEVVPALGTQRRRKFRSLY